MSTFRGSGPDFHSVAVTQGGPPTSQRRFDRGGCLNEFPNRLDDAGGGGPSRRSEPARVSWIGVVRWCPPVSIGVLRAPPRVEDFDRSGLGWTNRAHRSVRYGPWLLPWRISTVRGRMCLTHRGVFLSGDEGCEITTTPPFGGVSVPAMRGRRGQIAQSGHGCDREGL